MSTLLQVRGLVKRFPRWLGPPEPPAVAGVDLEVRPGETVGLIGESGSGKTTLVRCALGLVPYQEGEVSLLGQPLDRLSERALRQLRQRVQLLFQSPDAMLNPGLTVRQHLTESAALHRPEAPREASVQDTAASVGLGHRLDALPRQLSGGERRRVGLARVLLSRPELVVADEPTAGLDAALKADLIDLLLADRRPERGTLLVSHDLPLVAYACQRVVVMLSGRVVERFPVSALSDGAHHPYTAGLLRAAGMATTAPASRAAAPAGRAAAGCPWYGPCPLGDARCAREAPPLRANEGQHAIACHHIPGDA